MKIERVAVIKHGSAVNEVKIVCGLGDSEKFAMHDSIIPYAKEFLEVFSEMDLLFVGRKLSYQELEYANCRAVDVLSEFPSGLPLPVRTFRRLKADRVIRKEISLYHPQIVFGAGLSKDQAVQFDMAKKAGALYVPMIVGPLDKKPIDPIRLRYWKKEREMLKSDEVPYILTRGQFLRDHVIDITGVSPEKVLDYWPQYPPSFYEDNTPSPFVNEGPNLLWVGRLSGEKGVMMLPQIIEGVRKKHSNIKLNILGVGFLEDDLRSELKKIDPDEKNWELVGYIPSTEISRYFLNCDVFIMTSLDEGFGKTLFEGMLCGAPIVVSDVDNMPYLVQDGVRGFLAEPGNPESFIEKICTLLEDPKLAAEFGENAAKYSRDVHKPSFSSRAMEIIRKVEMK